MHAEYETAEGTALKPCAQVLRPQAPFAWQRKVPKLGKADGPNEETAPGILKRKAPFWGRKYSPGHRLRPDQTQAACQDHQRKHMRGACSSSESDGHGQHRRRVTGQIRLPASI